MFEQELSNLDHLHARRRLVTIDSAQGPWVTIEGRNVLLLCSNDYLGLANHPRLRRAAIDAVEQYGVGSRASRLVSGSMALHNELERRIAGFKGAASALLFNSGYAANTGIIPAAAGEGDVIFSDSLNHASIIDGCRLSRAKTVVYRHRDMNHLEALLVRHNHVRRKLIVTDSVFSMDGDIAPLPEIVSLAERHGAVVMVDDAHATGVLGGAGRGSVEHFGLFGRVHIQMGTFGKALGSFGAYIAAERDIVEYALNKARSFMFSTSMPPAICAASIAAIDIVQQEPERRKTLWENRKRLVDGLHSLGIQTGASETPIIPISVGANDKTLSISKKLFDAGVFATAIRPPTVPDGSSRIRTTITSAHSHADIDLALGLFKRLKEEGDLP